MKHFVTFPFRIDTVDETLLITQRQLMLSYCCVYDPAGSVNNQYKCSGFLKHIKLTTLTSMPTLQFSTLFAANDISKC